MASAVTLNSTTVEGQLYELLNEIVTMQGSAEQNPNGVTIVNSFSRNGLTETVSVSLTIQTQDSKDAAGKNVVEAAEVYVNAA